MTHTALKHITKNPTRPWTLIVAAVVLLSADRWFKALALVTESDGLLDNLFGLPIDFRLFLNDGIAFSLSLPDWIFWPTAVLASAALLYFLHKTWKTVPAAAVAIIFILLGGFSNVLDRLLHGAVIDYLIFFDQSAVNLADGMILGGAVGAYFILRKQHKDTLNKKLP